MKETNALFASFGLTVFEVMSQLALKHDAINLGQGFPDEDGPLAIREAAAKSLLEGPNQYPSMMGIPALRQAIAEHDRECYGLDLDWQKEVMVTSGATEALQVALFGLIEPGDEVVVMEPAYDCYVPMIKRAGGVPVIVRMEAPDWRLPMEALEAAFNGNTKAIVLNSPLNPAGRVFSWDELEALAELCLRHDVYAVCDEVYEHLTFEGHKHYPLMSLPGMRNHAVRIGSAGKSFSLTGWKVGYICAAAELMPVIAKAHQFATFTTSPALQAGVVEAMTNRMDFTRDLACSLQGKRDLLASGLEGLGFKILPTEGTYFLTVDISGLYDGRDEEFCHVITREAGVAAIPVSIFFDMNGPTHLVRFCFCKREEVLKEALVRLKKWLGR
ncbi:aminotransferase [Kiloniella sp. b19]|uniref:aminotransferase n=1 Tax=Kiloniella sp. GXU_MW_B19 TaxID=3141326 RepID=UPI0031D5F5F4